MWVDYWNSSCICWAALQGEAYREILSPTGKQCNHPGEPENGRITALADLFFGSTVVYSCEEG